MTLYQSMKDYPWAWGIGAIIVIAGAAAGVTYVVQQRKKKKVTGFANSGKIGASERTGFGLPSTLV
jgi:hypothetical protein